MGEIVPIEKAFDRKKRKIENDKRYLRELIQEAEGVRERNCFRRDHPHTANADVINELNMQIAQIDELLSMGNKLLERCDERALQNFIKKAEFLKRREDREGSE